MVKWARTPVIPMLSSRKCPRRPRLLESPVHGWAHHRRLCGRSCMLVRWHGRRICWRCRCRRRVVNPIVACRLREGLGRRKRSMLESRRLLRSCCILWCRNTRCRRRRVSLSCKPIVHRCIANRRSSSIRGVCLRRCSKMTSSATSSIPIAPSTPSTTTSSASLAIIALSVWRRIWRMVILLLLLLWLLSGRRRRGRRKGEALGAHDGLISAKMTARTPWFTPS